MAYSIHYIGAKWCSTCKTIQPQLEELCKKFQVPIHIKDLDEDLTEKEVAEIKKVPTVQIMKDAEILQVYDMKQVESVSLWLQQHSMFENSDNF